MLPFSALPSKLGRSLQRPPVHPHMTEVPQYEASWDSFCRVTVDFSLPPHSSVELLPKTNDRAFFKPGQEQVFWLPTDQVFCGTELDAVPTPRYRFGGVLQGYRPRIFTGLGTGVGSYTPQGMCLSAH